MSQPMDHDRGGGRRRRRRQPKKEREDGDQDDRPNNRDNRDRRDRDNRNFNRREDRRDSRDHDKRDYDRRDRDRPRNRRDSGSRESTPAPSTTPLTPTRTPIILAKPQPDRHGDSAEENLSVGGASQSQGTMKTDRPITVKTRDDHTMIANQNQSGNNPELNSPSAPGYRLQKPVIPSIIPQSDGTPQSRMAPPPEISQCIKLVDESLHWSDMGMDMLLDQTEYFVIGVIGTQGVGKSTIMSALAGNKLNTPYKSYIFKPQTPESQDVSGHQTNGIDMYVTSERVIILDAQPVLSSSVLFQMINTEKKIPGEYTTAENCHEMQSLQIVSFMYTVCNVVLVVMDWFADLFFLKFLQTAEMVKPPTPSTSHDNTNPEDHTEYYPHIAFILNKSDPQDFSHENYTSMEQTISKILTKSKLKYQGNLSTSSGKLLQSVNKNDKNSVNLFLLPKFDSANSSVRNNDPIYSLLPEYRGHPSFEFMIRQLRNQLYAMPRCLLTHTTLSEKNWFHYAARTWESIRKFQLLAEYNRLLP